MQEQKHGGILYHRGNQTAHFEQVPRAGEGGLDLIPDNTMISGGQKLPEGINYREYDVNLYVKGQGRGTERIVIGDDGSVWYTNSYYQTFQRMG